MSSLIAIVTSKDPAVRNRSLDEFSKQAALRELLSECAALDRFRRESDNLYERVRALFFLYSIHRFHLPSKLPPGAPALIPFPGYANLLKRRFDEAIDIFLTSEKADGPSAAISSA